jgi:hypothetical protein
MTALQKQIQKLAYEGRHYKIQNKNKVKNARLENCDRDPSIRHRRISG